MMRRNLEHKIINTNFSILQQLAIESSAFYVDTYHKLFWDRFNITMPSYQYSNPHSKSILNKLACKFDRMEDDFFCII